MNFARYTVHHETRYAYTAPVSQSWQLARLAPRMLPWQKLLSHSLEIEPRPDERRDELDCFGNMVTHFGLHGAHRMLSVRMECLVEVSERPTVRVSPAPEQALVQMPLPTQTQTQTQMQSGHPWGMQSQMQSGLGSLLPAQGQGPVAAAAGPGWEGVREAIRHEPGLDGLAPARMSESTPLVPLSEGDRKSTRLNSSHPRLSRMPSSA